MARNIPSLFSLTENRLYDLGVRSTNLEQYNYPEQLVERYEEFSRERAALPIQARARPLRSPKVIILRILNRIERRRQEMGLPRFYGEYKILNYNLTTEEGTIITRELNKLDIQDFMYQSFWWKLVRHGIQSFLPQFGFTMPATMPQAMRNRAINNQRLYRIISKFFDIDHYVINGIINPRDIGARYIRQNWEAFDNRIGDEEIMIGTATIGAALTLWNLGYGRLGVILPGPLQPGQVMFGRRR